MLFEDLEEIMDYDETMFHLWMSEYNFRGVDWWEGTQYSISSYDCTDS